MLVSYLKYLISPELYEADSVGYVINIALSSETNGKIL
jgi:hypothetical protein